MLVLQKQNVTCFLFSFLKYYIQKHSKTQCFQHVFLYTYLKTVEKKQLPVLAFLYDLGIPSKRNKWYLGFFRISLFLSYFLFLKSPVF